MRNTISGVVLLLILMLSLTACDKDNSTLLTDGVWTFQNLTTDSDDDNIIGLVALGKALMADATLELQEGGTFILSSPLLDDPTTGEWQLVGEDQLILDPDDELPSTSNIETLTKDKLSYMETFLDGQTNTYTITTTWTR